MAIQSLILKLEHSGISATSELPGGKWCHSEEYFALRVNGLSGLLRVLRRKVEEGSVRAKIQLALVTGNATLEMLNKFIGKVPE